MTNINPIHLLLTYMVLILLLITTEIRWTRSDCSVIEKLGERQSSEFYHNGRYICCKTTYPNLYKYIECNNTKVITGHQLTVDGAESATNVKYIVFENSDLPLIPIGVFTPFATLIQLFLNDTGVKTIHPGAFSGLAKLEELYLQDNYIDRIDRGTLNTLNNLIVLDLSYNELEKIEDNAFLGLFSLRTLSLHHNQLNELPANSFDSVNNLEEVNLSHNNLLSLPATLFSNLSQILRLNLSRNNLTSFEFFGCMSLKDLNLASNRIKTVKNWHNMQNIEDINLNNNVIHTVDIVPKNARRLNLSWNIISEINASMFGNAAELSIVDLSHNRILKMSYNSFANATKLKYLYLQNNNISKVAIGSFRNLHILLNLNLSSNQINELKFGTFAGLQSLENLDISNNKLKHVFENTFYTVENLKVLKIDTNFITSFNTNEFLGHLNKLTDISLNNNPWDCTVLLSIVTTFSKANVTVAKGHTKTVENIHGVACFNLQSEDNSSQSDDNQTLWEELRALMKVIKEDLSNSSSHKYFDRVHHFSTDNNVTQNYLKEDFHNSFEKNFKNTTFYKYFQQDFSSTTFFKSMNVSFAKLFQDIDRNSINSAQHMSQYFVKHFFEGVNNGTDSFKSFSHYFDENTQEIKDLKLLLTELHQYLEHSSTKVGLGKQVELTVNGSNSKAQFASYMGDNKEDMYAKFSELQTANSINNLLVGVLVALLLMIIILQVWSMKNNRLNKNKCSSKRVNSSTEMITDANLELI